jgi:hypothetical protein
MFQEAGVEVEYYDEWYLSTWRLYD